MPTTSGYIVVTFKFRKEGNRWVAYCEELGTSTFGRSIQESERKLGEAVLLHLNTLEDVDEIDNFFRENSLRFYRTKPSKDFRINAPIGSKTFYKPHVQAVPAMAS